MIDDRRGDEMIEIGDPAEEPTAPVPPPRVVIEYRDRGVPWMLVPPLLALSAVAAVLAYPRLAPAPDPGRRSPRAEAAAPPVEAPRVEPVAPAAPAEALTAPAPAFDLAWNTPAPETTPATPPADPAPMPPEPTPEPARRERGVGFDPKALEGDRDPALAPAGGPAEPGPMAVPAPGPVEPAPLEAIDPDLLPPDPKLARLRRERRAVEARHRAESERGQFHAELKAICRKPGAAAKTGQEIAALCKKYGTDVDPTIKAQATRLLNIAAAGADRPVRINLLRSLGFSEPVILLDLFGDQGKWEGRAARGGPRSEDDLMVRSAQLLLSHPPGRAATSSRAVSTIRALPAPAR